ncbi:MAG: DUF1127 domain-containing protein [Marivita sp.]|uniref:hypothetical protein n=1 Tax=Marivita sp. TaxID=2003365 RepID=UPI001B29A27D|nr:hypothetical protein [Marivita sp.]MBO6885267.1 DUF1127 domain-containing protein [Marivita sp.]
MSIEPLHLHFARPGLRHRIDLFFAEKGQGFNPMPMVRSRLVSILRLDAMSDAELASLGLTRDDILPFVFEDCFGDLAASKQRPTA